MTGNYSQLYFEANKECEKLKAELANTTDELGLHKKFIEQAGYTVEFLRWWAKEQNFSETTMQSIERAFAKIEIPT